MRALHHRNMFSWDMRKHVLFVPLLLLAGCHAQTIVQQPRADGAQTPLAVYNPPAVTNAPCPPLLIFSPGLGGTEYGYKYLADAVARQGWRVLVMGHKESGPRVLGLSMHRYGAREGVRHDLLDLNQNRARLMDVDAALQYADSLCHAPLRVLAGHSFGAVTAMEVAGAKNVLNLAPAAKFDAYIAISPEGPGLVFPDGAWAGIAAPMLLLTGTRDESASGDWRSRTLAFAGLPATSTGNCNWLGVSDGSTHINFSGNGILPQKTEERTIAAVNAFLANQLAHACTTPPAISSVTWQAK